MDRAFTEKVGGTGRGSKTQNYFADVLNGRPLIIITEVNCLSDVMDPSHAMVKRGILPPTHRSCPSILRRETYSMFQSRSTLPSFLPSLRRPRRSLSARVALNHDPILCRMERGRRPPLLNYCLPLASLCSRRRSSGSRASICDDHMLCWMAKQLRLIFDASNCQKV